MAAAPILLLLRVPNPGVDGPSIQAKPWTDAAAAADARGRDGAQEAAKPTPRRTTRPRIRPSSATQAAAWDRPRENEWPTPRKLAATTKKKKVRLGVPAPLPLSSRGR